MIKTTKETGRMQTRYDSPQMEIIECMAHGVMCASQNGNGPMDEVFLDDGGFEQN